MKKEELDKLVVSLDETSNTKKRVFQELLDEQREKGGHVLAVVAEMGDTLSYVTSVTLGWVAHHVRLASELPIWKHDEEGKIIHDEVTMDELRQRSPDWRRQATLVRYITLREHHKFPPILVAAWQDWVNDPGADEWVDAKLALRNSVSEKVLDSKAAYIDLDCEKTNFYALDGQHRVMAIRGLKELLDTGVLQKKNTVGKSQNKGELTTEGLEEELKELYPENTNTASARIHSLMNESIGIEIIPAVLKDEQYTSALQRLRSIFVHVNRTAKPLAKGTLAQLDDDDGFAIIARRIAVKHDLLKNKRVQMEDPNLKKTSSEYTTLFTLTQISELYLREKFPNWLIPVKGDLAYRPPDSQLDEGENLLMQYFDAFAKLPSHDDLIQDQTLSAAKYRADDADNILFWPIAQMAIAESIGILESNGESLGNIFQTLVEAESDSKLRLKDEKSIWFGVLCDVVNKNIRRHKSSQLLCTNLLLHLLGEGTPGDKRDELLDKFREARKTNAEGTKCMGMDGSVVSSERLKLPRPW